MNSKVAELGGAAWTAGTWAAEVYRLHMDGAKLTPADFAAVRVARLALREAAESLDWVTEPRTVDVRCELCHQERDDVQKGRAHVLPDLPICGPCYVGTLHARGLGS